MPSTSPLLTSPSTFHDPRSPAQGAPSRAVAHAAAAVLAVVYRRVATQRPTDVVSLRDACSIPPSELANALSTLCGLGLVRLVRASLAPREVVAVRMTFAGLAWASDRAAGNRALRRVAGSSSRGSHASARTAGRPRPGAPLDPFERAQALRPVAQQYCPTSAGVVPVRDAVRMCLSRVA